MSGSRIKDVLEREVGSTGKCDIRKAHAIRQISVRGASRRQQNEKRPPHEMPDGGRAVAPVTGPIHDLATNRRSTLTR